MRLPRILVLIICYLAQEDAELRQVCEEEGIDVDLSSTPRGARHEDPRLA